MNVEIERKIRKVCHSTIHKRGAFKLFEATDVESKERGKADGHPLEGDGRGK